MGGELQVNVRGSWGRKINSHVLSSQSPFVRLLLFPVLRNGDTQFMNLVRVEMRIFYIIFTAGISEILIRRTLKRVVGDA